MWQDLYDQSVVRGMLPEVSLHLNIDFMRQARVPDSQVARLLNVTLENAGRLGMLCPR